MSMIKLKHLPIIGSDKIEYSEVMTEIVGYKNTWLRRRRRFKEAFKIAYELIEEIRKVDISKVEWTEDCPIDKPANIDFICFQAMMELQALLEGGIEEDALVDNITKTIAISCFESSHKGVDYSSDNEAFENFRQHILQQPLIDMFGLYNWIVESINESSKMWSQRFLSVELQDADYDQANGHRMVQFNVIMSIKNICSDFNIPFKEAWLLSYNLVQTNSYSKATSTKIQDDMRILKEARMKATRQQ